jgi:hypothetical protein
MTETLDVRVAQVLDRVSRQVAIDWQLPTRVAVRVAILLGNEPDIYLDNNFGVHAAHVTGDIVVVTPTRMIKAHLAAPPDARADHGEVSTDTWSRRTLRKVTLQALGQDDPWGETPEHGWPSGATAALQYDQARLVLPFHGTGGTEKLTQFAAIFPGLLEDIS